MKKLNWKKINSILIHLGIILILQIPFLVYLIGHFVPYAEINEFKISWIDYLRLSKNVSWIQIWILYLFIFIGEVLTIIFIKAWYRTIKDQKNKEELLKSNELNTQKIVEAINSQKKGNKDADKYW